MDSLAECQTVSVSLARPADEVYHFLADPGNLPKWSFFITSITRQNGEWVASTSQGQVRIRFVPANKHGILDHWVRVNPELEVYVPLRVAPNGSAGSEVLFSIFRLPGMSDEQYEEDIGMVRRDLTLLKRVMEAQ